MDNLPYIHFKNDSLKNQSFIFTYQPLDSLYYNKREDELERLEKIISTDFYANAISTLAIILTIAIFIRQNYINNRDRKKETKKSWYMSVIIQPNLNNIDTFYNQIHQRINNNINSLKRINDGRFIPRQKARANRALRDLRNDFLDNFVTIIQSYDKSLATNINRIINDLQDLCSNQIDNYSNADISQIKKRIYENRASLISLLYDGIKEEKEKWYKRIFKRKRR
ncbi:hypothetical protein H6B28_12395 [Bacteroides mediterraneensis]|nr:hypothetical protein [Bacteroides mediterraneensis]